MTVAEAGAQASADTQPLSQAQGQPLSQSLGQSPGQTGQASAPGGKTAGAGAASAKSGSGVASASPSAVSSASSPAQTGASAAPTAGDAEAPSRDADAAAPAVQDPAAPAVSPDPTQPGALAAAAAAPPAQTPSPAADAARAGPQTVARLATQIVQTAQGPASQFSLVLHPAELGGVQVKVQVGRDGRVSAALTFDNAQAAADLGARADELKAQLAQAGFDVADGGLSFSLNGQGRQTQDDGSSQANLMGGRAFRNAAAGAEDLLAQVNEAASRLTSASAAGGLDIRI
jgi:Meckel syndrome type 1 protein